MPISREGSGELQLITLPGGPVGFSHFPEGVDDDVDDPIALLALAMATNFGGWVVGLTAGAATAHVLRRRKS